MDSKIINILSPTSTGNQPYTGVGFQPKVIIAFGGGSTPLTDGATNAPFVFGAAASTSQRGSVSGVANDAQATANVGNGRSTTGVIHYRSAAGTLQHFADLVSFDSDGFTLNWSTVNATQREFFILCLGGADVSAAVGNFQAGGATGNRSVTGLSFQPNTLIFFDSRVSSTETGSSTFWRPMVGFVDSAGNQGAWAGDSHDGTAAATTTSAQSTSACIINSATAASDIDRRATFVSYNSDGFTVNFTTLDASIALNSYVWYVALNVPFSLVGNVDQRTSTGTTVVTTTGFTPKAIMMGGDGTTTTNGATQDHRFSLGAAVGTGTTDHGYHTHHDQDNQDPTNVSRALNTSYILRWITANGASPTTIVSAAISEIANGSFTINYDTVDATARKVIYLAMGDNIVVTTRIPRMGFINFQNPGIA